MKNTIFIFFLLFLFLSVFSQQQKKTGLSFNALPSFSYDSDLGFQYGGFTNFYLYGDGERYPNYNHLFFFEFLRYTKGTNVYHLMYDSETLLPAIRTTFDATYMTDKLMDFYGFNGYQSVYDRNIETNDRAFYKTDKTMFRAKVDFQGNFGSSNWGWVAGYTFYHFAMDSVNTGKLNIPKSTKSLYELYHDWGFIADNEYQGGNINYIKLGLKYDSRNERINPTKGIWSEAAIQTAPKFLNKSYPHSKFAVIHRQYFSLLKDLSFAFRLDYQMTLGNGKVPFYAQPLLVTSYMTAPTNQGMGGRASLRGILQNRVVGDAIGFGNLELRYKFCEFTILKQRISLGTNLFFDSGIVLKPINMDVSGLNTVDKNKYFNDYKSGQFHSTIGFGLKIGWNENFIMSFDFGKALNKQDGNYGIYSGLNYLF